MRDFELEAVRRLGYRIVSTPDKVTANEIQLGLKTETLGHTIHFFEEVDSTQRIAAKLAYEGAPEGTLVVAEEQKAGRGRLDRKWFSPKGTGIWMSLILRPPIPPQRVPQLTMLVAVAISQAIQEVTGLVPDIKWPNDILLHGKKGVGILTELQADPDRVRSVIVGHHLVPVPLQVVFILKLHGSLHHEVVEVVGCHVLPHEGTPFKVDDRDHVASPFACENTMIIKNVSNHLTLGPFVVQ